MNPLAKLVDRFKEPSSWAGIASMLALTGVNLDPGLWQYIVLVGTGIAGIIAFFTPESKGTA